MSIRVSPSGTFILALALALPPFPFFLHSITHMQKRLAAQEATQGQAGQRLVRGKPLEARRVISSAIQNEDRQQDACMERGCLTIRQRCLKSREAAEVGSRRHPRRDGAIRTMGIEI
jgi:hypothetical protein